MRCVPGTPTSEPWFVSDAPVDAAAMRACVSACACAGDHEGLTTSKQVCEARGQRLATAKELETAAKDGPHCMAPFRDLERLADLTGPWPGWKPQEPPHGPRSWYAEDPVYRTWYGRDLPHWQTSYKDHEHALALLKLIHDENPGLTELHELGRSHQNRPIMALRLTDPAVAEQDKVAVFLNGAHHGDELLTIDYAFDAIERILQRPEWLVAMDIWVVPVVNPDGVWHTAMVDHGGSTQDGGRKNGRIPTELCGDTKQRRGVDLNRNYPFKWMTAGASDDENSWKYAGPEAGSEPEVAAILALAEARRFVAAITWHTYGSTVLRPYTIPDTRNPEPDLARIVAELMKPGDFTIKSALYPVSGTYQDWHFHQHGTLAFIVEGDRHNPVPRADRLAAVEAVRPALDGLLGRILEGPRVYGFVLHDHPARVEVRIEGYRTYEGERWTARPDGRFDRLVVGEGPFTIVAEVDGRRVQTTVTLDELPVELDLRE